jgi:hypothetical protein
VTVEGEMRAFAKRARRGGLSALEVIMTAALVLPIAAFMYWVIEQGLDLFFFTLGNTVGWPYL